MPGVPFTKNHQPKVCVMGFQKAGTQSMRIALQRLGFSVGLAGASRQIRDVGRKEIAPDEFEDRINQAIYETFEAYDAVKDIPMEFKYEFVDQHFPNTKFIMTTRDPESWLKSFKAYFGKGPNISAQQRHFYGIDSLEGADEKLVETMLKTNANARTYFQGRDNFIEFRLGEDWGWIELVNFLGKSHIPKFLHSNKAVQDRPQKRPANKAAPGRPQKRPANKAAPGRPQKRP